MRGQSYSCCCSPVFVVPWIRGGKPPIVHGAWCKPKGNATTFGIVLLQLGPTSALLSPASFIGAGLLIATKTLRAISEKPGGSQSPRAFCFGNRSCWRTSPCSFGGPVWASHRSRDLTGQVRYSDWGAKDICGSPRLLRPGKKPDINLAQALESFLET